MIKHITLSLLIILAFSVSLAAQQKTALATYVSSADGSHRGQVTLKVNGKLMTLHWDGTTRSYPPAQSNPRGFEKGAEWRITYLPCSDKDEDYDDAYCPFLVSATFTGRNLSQTQNKTSGQTFKQNKFTVFAECASNCNAKYISFIYEDGLRIDVSIGYSAFSDPSVGYNKGKTEKDYIYYRAPTARFIEKGSKQKASLTLKKLLLDVYNLGVYCEDNNIRGSNFSETGKFKVLASLRQYLKL